PSYRFDVFPMPAASSADADLLLPQTFEWSEDDTDIDMVLRRPVVLQGEITAYEVGPLARSTPLPGAEVPLQGSVTVRREGTVQSRTVTTSESGAFALSIVPGDGYRIAVVPTDPGVAMYTA